jgi:hypothetical protein
MPVQLLVEIRREELVWRRSESYVERQLGKRVVDRALFDDDAFREGVLLQIVGSKEPLERVLRPLLALRAFGELDLDRRGFCRERCGEADDCRGNPPGCLTRFLLLSAEVAYFPTMCPRSRLFSWQMYSYNSAPAAHGIV